MSWLSDDTIIEKIEKNANAKTKQAFHGIFAIDNLPSFIPHYPCFIIVNTHTHNLNGEHWIAMFIDGHKRGELFDSLAFPPSNHTTRWLNKFTRKWTRNRRIYQHPMSATCGAYVIFYVLKRLSYTNFSEFQALFTVKPVKNEDIVLKYYHSLE